MLTLQHSVKGHTFIVRYEQGQESKVLDQLVAWVNDTSLPFDWFDAAVISNLLGKRLGEEIKNKLQQ